MGAVFRSLCPPSDDEEDDEDDYSDVFVSKVEISWPTQVKHLVHVTFDRFKGFLGLPEDLKGDVPSAPSASRSVFGVHAESMQCAYDEQGNSVPKILLLLQARLYNQGGLSKEGIFRVAAGIDHEELVRNKLNLGQVPDDIDSFALAGLIKAWFRELPEGVLDSLPEDEVAACEDEEGALNLLTRLEPVEANLLDWAVDLMADVAAFEETNKMNAYNIAMVFAPNMTQRGDPLTALRHAVEVIKLLMILIARKQRLRSQPPEPPLVDTQGVDTPISGSRAEGVEKAERDVGAERTASGDLIALSDDGSRRDSFGENVVRKPSLRRLSLDDGSGSAPPSEKAVSRTNSNSLLVEPKRLPDRAADGAPSLGASSSAVSDLRVTVPRMLPPPGRDSGTRAPYSPPRTSMEMLQRVNSVSSVGSDGTAAEQGSLLNSTGAGGIPPERVHTSGSRKSKAKFVEGHKVEHDLHASQESIFRSGVIQSAALRAENAAVAERKNRKERNSAIEEELVRLGGTPGNPDDLRKNQEAFQKDVAAGIVELSPGLLRSQQGFETDEAPTKRGGAPDAAVNGKVNGRGDSGSRSGSADPAGDSWWKSMANRSRRASSEDAYSHPGSREPEGHAAGRDVQH
eukprot:jgi/Mesen1/4405/ME000225S03391